MARKFHKLLGFILLSGWAVFAHAAGMDELTGLLSRFQTYKAQFAQQSFEQNGEPLQSLQGEIILQKPDHFYWESAEPYSQKLLSNGKTIWHYDADLEQVVIQEFSRQAEQAPILVVLREPQKLAKTYKLASSEHKGNVALFRLEALDKKAALEKVEIGFTEGVLSSLVFIDHLQQKTAMQFSAVILNEEFPAAMFEFTLPEGVDVLYE